MTRTLNRRRFIGISAATLGLAMAPFSAKGAKGARPYRWRGVAMGADAEMLLYHDDIDVAEKLTKACLAEVQRLEKIFSLYRPDSAISQLNANGELLSPPIELMDLLSRARTISEQTSGAFDVTVQSLWRLYHDHFTGNPRAAPLSVSALSEARSLVDYRAVHIRPESISFDHKGMAITLNGIAQGYITDAVTSLLRRAGMTNILVNMGEIRSLGSHPDGASWRVGLPTGDDRPLALEGQAIATSAGSGLVFDADIGAHHIFDTRTGKSANKRSAISVVADNATLADAFSTAFMSMDEQSIRHVANDSSLEVIYYP